MRVALVSPTCADSSIPFGGGERYVEELAKALAASAEVRLVSFAERARTERTRPGLERVVLRSWTRDPLTPFSPRLGAALRGFDVVHCFQYYSFPTFLAARIGKRQGSRVFVTDLGGGGWTPAYQIDQSRWIDGHLPLSEYAARRLPGRPRPHRVIYGGVDLDKFRMRARPEHDGSVVFLGRILPHKGVHFLIDAMPADRALHVIGPVADADYLSDLHRRASGKRVEFHHGLGDEQVVETLQRAMALVHATTVDASGDAGAHELLGLAVLEGMACGCPVVVSRAASLPELVDEQDGGLLVAPNRSDTISTALDRLATDSSDWRARSQSARERVCRQFTWSAVSGACRLEYERTN